MSELVLPQLDKRMGFNLETVRQFLDWTPVKRLENGDAYFDVINSRKNPKRQISIWQRSSGLLMVSLIENGSFVPPTIGFDSPQEMELARFSRMRRGQSTEGRAVTIYDTSGDWARVESGSHSQFQTNFTDQPIDWSCSLR